VPNKDFFFSYSKSKINCPFNDSKSCSHIDPCLGLEHSKWVNYFRTSLKALDKDVDPGRHG